MGTVARKEQCPRCAENGGDSSSDNLNIYEDGSSYCFACNYSNRSSSSGSTRFYTGEIRNIESRKLHLEALGVYGVSVFTYTGQLGKDNYANDEICLILPYYSNGSVVKQKIRSLYDRSKCFQTGDTKAPILFGQQAFTPSKKIPIIITEAELDAVSVHQVMRYPAVSVGGTGNAVKLISENIAWLTEWAHVVLCFDNDDAGRQAVEKCVNLFEIGKVRVTHLPLKDANDMLIAGRDEELKRCIWNSEIIKPTTIVTVQDIAARVMERPVRGISWPFKFMDRVTYGMMPGTMYTLGASEGVGKTQFIQELIFDLLEKNVKVGLFSFEQDPASTVQRLIGAKVNRRFHLPDEPGWNNDLIKQEMVNLNEKIYLYDNRGTLSIDTIILNIRYLVKCYDLKFFVIDNMTALCSNCVIDGKPVHEVEYIGIVAARLHSLIKELKICVFIVSHLANDKISKSTYVSTSSKITEGPLADASPDEMDKMTNKAGLTWETGRMPAAENLYAGGMLRKLSDYVIVLARNRMSEDDEERSTLRVKFVKARLSSELEGVVYKLKFNYGTGRYSEETVNSVL